MRLRRAADRIGRLIRIMEVCGTHTVSASRSGLRRLLPENVKLISGPGCPVCVTSQAYIDAVVRAALDGMCVATYGDMVRVPGSSGSLERARASGGRVEVVTSALQALKIAKDQPDTEVVFAAVGFETTAPATADVLLRAARERVFNFSVLTAHKMVVPAMRALLESGEVQIDGFLCPGHVSVIIGSRAYEPLVRQFGSPCVIAGFEPIQMLEGLTRIVEQIAEGQPRLENVYGVAVTPEGNRTAQEMMRRVFDAAPAVWRAMGEIPDSGMEIRDEFADFDAAKKHDITFGPETTVPGCRCGDVIKGLIDPPECPLFGTACTPRRPVGPCMVSSEGSCQAFYKYGDTPQRRRAGSMASQ